MLQLAACGGLWPEQRRHEAFLQDHANCPRCDTAEIETEEHRFYFCKGNTTGDPDLVAKTDWILPEVRVGLTKSELRCFFLRGLTPGSWLVEPYDGPEVFLIADAFMTVFILALAHISPMVPNYFPIHAVVRLVGVSVLSQQISNCAQEHVDRSHLTMLLCQWPSSLQSSSWLGGLLGPSTSTPIASMCVLATTSSHSARNEAHVTLLDQIAANFVETSGNGRDLYITTDNFHQFAMTPPRVGKLLSMRLARSPELSVWSMSALGT